MPPSSFIENTLNPLTQLNQQKLFNTLDSSVKFKIYETVLYSGMKELKNLIDTIIGEERKMHESLMKYKKDDDDSGLTDFDKMLV